LNKAALLQSEVVNRLKEDSSIMGVVLFMKAVKMQTIKDVEKLTESIE
jgi:hypothetical protein